MSEDQNAGRSHDIKTDSSCFVRVEQFRYLGTPITNQNSIQEENKCRLKSQNVWYHSVQNTIYKTAHLKVFTDYWMYPVSLFASSFSRSKQKSTHTHTCCLCEAYSVLKLKCSQYKQLFHCSARTFTATVLSTQQFSCQCAPSLNIYDCLPLNSNFSSVLPVSLLHIPYFLHLFIFLSSFFLPLISSLLFESYVKLLRTATYKRFSYFVIRYILTKKCGKLRVFVQ